MIADIHSHTYYSNCGIDDPRLTIQAAIDGGLDIFGISDHNYGIADRKTEYFQLLTELRDEYADRIKLVRGVELCTLPKLAEWFEKYVDISEFDYCLVENIDGDESIVGLDIFDYPQKFGCLTGIAHTDLIGFARKLGEDPVAFLRRFADNNIFWEMNVNYDGIHAFREHAYVNRFYESRDEQDIIRESGIKLSVGFDGHRVGEYKPERVIRMCNFIEEQGIPMVTFD